MVNQFNHITQYSASTLHMPHHVPAVAHNPESPLIAKHFGPLCWLRFRLRTPSHVWLAIPPSPQTTVSSFGTSRFPPGGTSTSPEVPGGSRWPSTSTQVPSSGRLQPHRRMLPGHGSGRQHPHRGAGPHWLAPNLRPPEVAPARRCMGRRRWQQSTASSRQPGSEFE